MWTNIKRNIQTGIFSSKYYNNIEFRLNENK